MEAFPLLGEPLAVDLVNTVLARRGQVEDLLDSGFRLQAWLRAHADDLPVAASPTAADLKAFRELRAALRVLLTAAVAATAPTRKAIEVLNSAATRSAKLEQLTWSCTEGPRLQRVYQDPEPNGIVLGEVASSGIALLTGPDRDALRRCPGPGCVLFFVASNPRRHWCSAKICGNRVKVARHYRRRQRAADGRAPSG